MHVGSAEQSRYLLIDALTLCVPLLARLGDASDWFYATTRWTPRGPASQGCCMTP